MSLSTDLLGVVNQDTNYRIDIVAEGDGGKRLVQTSYTHEKKVVVVAALGHVDGEEAPVDYELTGVVTVMQKPKAHLKKKKKKKKAAPFALELSGAPWEPQPEELDGRELSIFHHKERVVDCRYSMRSIFAGKEHTVVLTFPPLIVLRLEVRRVPREEVVRDAETGERTRVVRKEWHIRGVLEGLNAAKDFRYFEVTLNGHHTVKVTRDGPFKFTDWYYTPPGVLLEADARPDEVYRLEVNTQRLAMVLMMRPVAPPPPDLAWGASARSLAITPKTAGTFSSSTTDSSTCFLLYPILYRLQQSTRSTWCRACCTGWTS